MLSDAASQRKQLLNYSVQQALAVIWMCAE